MPNPYITPSLNFEFHYFFMRKLWFAYLSKALIVFPGGFGTLDEMFEILTLAQTHKLAKKITVLIYGSEYWKKVFNPDALVDSGAISPKDIELLQYADTPEQAFEMLKQGLTENYLIPEAQTRQPENIQGPELLGRQQPGRFPAAGHHQDTPVRRASLQGAAGRLGREISIAAGALCIPQAGGRSPGVGAPTTRHRHITVLIHRLRLVSRVVKPGLQ